MATSIVTYAGTVFFTLTETERVLMDAWLIIWGERYSAGDCCYCGARWCDPHEQPHCAYEYLSIVTQVTGKPLNIPDPPTPNPNPFSLKEFFDA